MSSERLGAPEFEAQLCHIVRQQTIRADRAAHFRGADKRRIT